METQDTYWIPALTDILEKKVTLSEIDFAMNQIQPEKGQVDEKRIRERFDACLQALSPYSEMVRVKAGSFRMGDEVGDLSDECRPVHTVILTYDYWIGRYPVTCREYDAFYTNVRIKPSSHGGDHGWGRGARPVLDIDWNDAAHYCNWLSEREGLKPAYVVASSPSAMYVGHPSILLDRKGRKTEDITQVEGYRLLTEAEWEYAARGGHKSTGDYKYAGSDNIDEVAWHRGNSKEKTHPVGLKKPNELGVYDMSGNVAEWCHDLGGVYLQNTRVNPVGTFEEDCGRGVLRGFERVADRVLAFDPADGYMCGFRIARTAC